MHGSCEGPSAIAYSCWAMGAIVVVVIAWLACTQLSATFASPPPPPSVCGGAASARRAVSARHAGHAGSLPQQNCAQPLQQAFNEIPTAHMQKTTASMPWDRTKESQLEAVVSGDFMALFIDDENMTNLKPMSKDGARRGANTNAFAGTRSSRAQTGKASNLGVDTVAALRPRAAAKTIGKCPISFNDSDQRQMEYDNETSCFSKENCPWNDCR